MNDHADRDADGNVVLPFVHDKFNVEDAAQQFELYVRDDENLLDCKLVSYQICFCSAFLYLFSLQIFYSNPFSLIDSITNLMKQNQILLPRLKDQHYSLYTMNRHRETLDIHDTRRYSGPVDQTTRWHKSEYHSDRTEMVIFFLFSPFLFFFMRGRVEQFLL